MGFLKAPFRKEQSRLYSIQYSVWFFQMACYANGSHRQSSSFPISDGKSLSRPYVAKQIPYLDDCIIFSRTAEEHIARLREVFQRFKYANLKINPLKCEFFRQHVPFLGHIVSRDGIQANPGKTSALRQYPVPKSVTEVKSFCWVSVPTTDGTFAISPQLLDLFFS